ncbi:peptide deformylase [Patescibacteria group bacterium]|nr:peptide deformylase [Patescibacteria group bacterium]
MRINKFDTNALNQLSVSALKFLKPDDPGLRKIAKKIPQDQINSLGTIQIIETMLGIARKEQKSQDKPIMVGLAAPQIGILKRIILVDIEADGKSLPRRLSVKKNQSKNKAGKVRNLRISLPKKDIPLKGLKVYINPEIVWQSKKEGEWYEGCYSTGRICGIVSRPIAVKIKAIVLKNPSVKSLPSHDANTTSGNTQPIWSIVEEKHTGYTARIFQHEVDHLNGKLFIDHIKDQNNLHWVKESEFPLYKQCWKNWPKKHPLPLA